MYIKTDVQAAIEAIKMQPRQQLLFNLDLTNFTTKDFYKHINNSFHTF